MASVNLLNVDVVNPGKVPFLTPFQFQITFECVAPITADLVRGAHTLEGGGGLPAHHARARTHPPPPFPPKPAHPKKTGLEGGVRGQRKEQGL